MAASNTLGSLSQSLLQGNIKVFHGVSTSSNDFGLL